MLTGSLWVLGVTVAGGLGLSCFYLLERPIRGAAWWASLVHGAVGAVGVGMMVAGVWAGAADAGGFGRFAAGALGVALLAGVMVLVARLRGGRPPGLVVALHGAVGVAGFVILLAYASLPR